MNRIFPPRFCSASPGMPLLMAISMSLLSLQIHLWAQVIEPAPKADPATEEKLGRVFTGVAEFFSAREPWVQPVAQKIPDADLRQLSFSLVEEEKMSLANNIVMAGVAGFRPENNRPGKSATITIYHLADTRKGRPMMKGLTEILNANRNALEKNPDLKVIDFQSSQPEDETFALLSYFTYSLTQNSDPAKAVEKFQVLRAFAGDLFIDCIVMNGDIPKENLLGAAKLVLKNWKSEQESRAPKFRPEPVPENGKQVEP